MVTVSFMECHIHSFALQLYSLLTMCESERTFKSQQVAFENLALIYVDFVVIWSLLPVVVRLGLLFIPSNKGSSYSF